MKIAALAMLFLLLMGCGSQRTWTVEKWGPAEGDLRSLHEVEVRNFELPEKILGSQKPGDSEQWHKEWPAEIADSFADMATEESEDHKLTARFIRAQPARHIMTYKIELLDIGSSYGHRVMSGIATITRADGTVVVVLRGHNAQGRGWTPSPKGQASDMGKEFAEFLHSQR